MSLTAAKKSVVGEAIERRADDPFPIHAPDSDSWRL
jgi:hypothetical protein